MKLNLTCKQLPTNIGLFMCNIIYMHFTANNFLLVGKWDIIFLSCESQGCYLTGARSPEAPKLRVRATKVLFKEPEWAPKDQVFILN